MQDACEQMKEPQVGADDHDVQARSSIFESEQTAPIANIDQHIVVKNVRPVSQELHITLAKLDNAGETHTF